MTRQSGSAHIMVIMVATIVLLLVSALLLVSISGRRATERYINFASLYDLAIAGNEQALFMLQQGVDANRNQITASTIALLLENAELNLTYSNRQFSFTNNIFWTLFTQEANYFAFQNAGGSRTWNTHIDFFTDDGRHFSDRYQAETTVTRQADSFHVSTVISKHTDNQPGYPARVDARIIWNEPDCNCVFSPQFAWRSTPKFDNYDHSLLPFIQQNLHPNDSLIIITDNYFTLDISTFTEPTAIIFTGNMLHLMTTNPVADNFHSIVASFGEIIFDGVSVTDNPNILFEIKLSPILQQYFFDFLNISNFSRVGDSASISDVLGYLSIIGGEILRNCLDDYAFAMVELLRVAD